MELKEVVDWSDMPHSDWVIGQLECQNDCYVHWQYGDVIGPDDFLDEVDWLKIKDIHLWMISEGVTNLKEVIIWVSW